MDRDEIERTIAPARAIYESGPLRGAAFFADPATTDSVTFGTADLSESEVGVAVWRIITGRGFNVARICTAVVMLDKSEQQRN